LEMKLIDVEFTFDNNKIIFYFTADGRVDFRELVKDLASVFRTRIELRQIGVRDEAKMIGGLGPCGRKLCCSSWLGDFDPVSIRMAKDQNLSLNPAKISGICGRLMCCLKYEHETYQYLEKQLPKMGKKIETFQGPGIVISKNLMTQSVKVLVEGKHERDREIITIKVNEIEDPRGESPRQIENPSDIQDMKPILFASVNNRSEKPESLKKGVQKPSGANASRNEQQEEEEEEEEKSETGETNQKSNYKKRRRKKKTSERKKETNIGVQPKKDDNTNAGKKWNKRKPKE
ncbi:MAG: hypothetical protein JJE29_09340, partial [Peptostreptococcaceae bacterium]|nr:hypothetical protein [Peptostreptococcaceae bacterium]